MESNKGIPKGKKNKSMEKLTIYYFKGLESDYNGTKLKQIREEFTNCNVQEIIYPDLNKVNDFTEIKNVILAQIKAKDYMFVGSSLGGYLSVAIANEITVKSDPLSIVNINPAPDNFIKELILNAPSYKIPIMGCTTILGKNDDLFSYKDNVNKFKNKCKIVLDETGNHRTIDKNILITEIRKSINYGTNDRII